MDLPKSPKSLPIHHLHLGPYVYYGPNGVFVLHDGTGKFAYVLGDALRLATLLAYWERTMANFRTFCETNRPRVQEEEGGFVIISEQSLCLQLYGPKPNTLERYFPVTNDWLKQMFPVFQKILEEARKAPKQEHYYSAGVDGDFVSILNPPSCVRN